MSLALLGIELYLAAMLGVSGLAKVEQPGHFAATLRRHRILPAWSIPAVSRVLPWLELAVACSLVAGVVLRPAAVLVLVLFASFLVVEVVLVVTKRATDCGCYGVAYPQKVDRASIMVSAVFVTLAAFHLWAVTGVAPVSADWRLPGIAIFGAAVCWALWRMASRRRLGRCMSCGTAKTVQMQAEG